MHKKSIKNNPPININPFHPKKSPSIPNLIIKQITLLNFTCVDSRKTINYSLIIYHATKLNILIFYEIFTNSRYLFYNGLII
jgi:hypothetical protein